MEDGLIRVRCEPWCIEPCRRYQAHQMSVHMDFGTPPPLIYLKVAQIFEWCKKFLGMYHLLLRRFIRTYQLIAYEKHLNKHTHAPRAKARDR